MDKIFYIVVLIALIGITNAYAMPTYDLGTNKIAEQKFSANNIDWSQCNPHCIEYIPNHNGRTNADNQTPQQFDIFMPDGACNAKGWIQQPSGTCSAPKIVLGPFDWIQLKNDPGVFAVVNIASTNLPQNIDYCELANFTWVHQDVAFQTKYNKTLVIPAYCLNNHIPAIPEFGEMASIVLALSITAFVMIPRIK